MKNCQSEQDGFWVVAFETWNGLWKGWKVCAACSLSQAGSDKTLVEQHCKWVNEGQFEWFMFWPSMLQELESCFALAYANGLTKPTRSSWKCRLENITGMKSSNTWHIAWSCWELHPQQLPLQAGKSYKDTELSTWRGLLDEFADEGAVDCGITGHEVERVGLAPGVDRSGLRSCHLTCL